LPGLEHADKLGDRLRVGHHHVQRLRNVVVGHFTVGAVVEVVVGVDALLLEIVEELQSLDSRGSAKEPVDGPSKVEDRDQFRVGGGSCVSELCALTLERVSECVELWRQAYALPSRLRSLDRAETIRTIARRNVPDGRRWKGEEWSRIAYG
jgi:hypothetical protein